MSDLSLEKKATKRTELRFLDDGKAWLRGNHGRVIPHKNLKAWQHAHRLAVECGKVTRTFPSHDRGVVADQILRASSSVPLNIAEGSARRGSKEFRRFLDTARGSLAEVESGLELAKDLGYLTEDDFNRLDAIAVEASKTLWGLLRKVSQSALHS